MGPTFAGKGQKELGICQRALMFSPSDMDETTGSQWAWKRGNEYPLEELDRVEKRLATRSKDANMKYVGKHPELKTLLSKEVQPGYDCRKAIWCYKIWCREWFGSTALWWCRLCTPDCDRPSDLRTSPYVRCFSRTIQTCS